MRRVAAGSFGVPVAQLYAGDVPGGEADPLAVVTAMLGRGIPMLALVHGAVLGRGEGYGNHWIVLWRDARATGTMHKVTHSPHIYTLPGPAISRCTCPWRLPQKEQRYPESPACIAVFLSLRYAGDGTAQVNTGMAPNVPEALHRSWGLPTLGTGNEGKGRGNGGLVRGGHDTGAATGRSSRRPRCSASWTSASRSMCWLRQRGSRCGVLSCPLMSGTQTMQDGDAAQIQQPLPNGPRVHYVTGVRCGRCNAFGSATLTVRAGVSPDQGTRAGSDGGCAGSERQWTKTPTRSTGPAKEGTRVNLVTATTG